MPTVKTIYDRVGNVPLQRYAVSAEEAVKNDPNRYSEAKWAEKNVVDPNDEKAVAALAEKDEDPPVNREPVVMQAPDETAPEVVYPPVEAIGEAQPETAGD